MGARILVVDDSPTIRKVVSSILARHSFEAVQAADGVEALEALAQGIPDLVLVDFVMPRMNGYQFCMMLRQKPEFAKVPVVLMSAKSDKIRGKFVEQTGALDAITKPFDARGLIAVVESALAKRDELRKGNSEPPRREKEPLSSPEGQEAAAVHANQSVQRLADHLAKVLEPELARLDKVKPSVAELTNVLAHLFTPKACADLAAIVSDAEFVGKEHEILSGDLASISIAEILQLLDMQRKTGALTLSYRRSRVTLFVREGRLDFATYAGLPEEFLLGRYLVETGALSREALEEFIELARASGKVLGDYLVGEGVMSPEQLKKALTNQTSELLYEVVRWREGRFRFIESSDNTLASRAELGLHTAGLVMEGFRRVDEWRLIEDSFDFADVLYRDEQALSKLDGVGDLTEFERSVLVAIDGDTSVAELVDNIEASSFEICKVLYRLLNSRVVKRRAA